jgi:thioredoxin-dependent peroxiredoxin
MAAKRTVPKKRTEKAPKKASKKLTKKPTKTTADLPAAGTKAPAFSLPRDGGSMVALADFAGNKLVLYFYPRADTSGCTREAIDFSRLRGDFSRAGTAIVGVSADPVAAQDKFKAKHKLSIALASDETHRMLEAYGVWQEKSMYGRKFLGIARTTFLIGADGRIAKVWPRVSVDGHAAEVLAAAKAL